MDVLPDEKDGEAESFGVPLDDKNQGAGAKEFDYEFKEDLSEVMLIREKRLKCSGRRSFPRYERGESGQADREALRHCDR